MQNLWLTYASSMSRSQLMSTVFLNLLEYRLDFEESENKQLILGISKFIGQNKMQKSKIIFDINRIC